MLKFALILFFIYALMLIYSAMDLSKDGIIDKKRKMAQMKQKFNKKVRDPYNDMLNTKVSLKNFADMEYRSWKQKKK